MKKECVALMLLLLCCSSFAQDREEIGSGQELRIGIGDMMFETVR